MLLATLPFQTPRLVGEALYAGGKVAKKVSNLSKKTGMTSPKANTLSDLLQNINKAKEEE
jgi:hypothetical protein